MRYTNEHKDAMVIFSGNIARKLLRKGYTIIDVKADRTNKIKSVFVFKVEGNFEHDVWELTNKDNDVFTTE